MPISILGLILCAIGILPATGISEMSLPHRDGDLITSGLFLISLGLANILAEKMPATPTLWARALAALALGFIACVPFLQRINDAIPIVLVVTGFAAYIYLTARKHLPNKLAPTR